MNEYALEKLLEEEATLVFAGFDNDVAIDLGCEILRVAQARSLPVAICVSRNGQQLFFAALPGTSLDNQHWIARKSAVVDRFGHSSFYMGRFSAAGGAPFNERFKVDPMEYSAYGGSFPIIVKGTGVIGAVTVSGLPEREDHEFVVECLAAFIAARSR